MDEIIGGAIYYICAAFFMCVLLKLDLSNKKKLAAAIALFFIGFILVMALCIITGFDAVLYLLPLVVLLPLYFVFWFISVYKGLKLLFALLTSSILMLLPMLVGLAVSDIIYNELLMTIVALLVIVASIVLMIKLFRPQFLFIMHYVDSKGYWLAICAIPLLYNAAVYMLGLYNMEAEVPTPQFFQLCLMGITLTAYILILLTFAQIKRRVEMEYDNQAAEIQINAAMEKIDQMKELHDQTAIYRHDLRHHVQMIHSYLSEHEYEKTEHYLKQIQTELDETPATEYCKNRSINLILSAYAQKAKKEGAEFLVNADIPEELHISEKDMCVILSNALENAVNAVCKITDGGQKTISLECKTKNKRLAFALSNTYRGEISFEHGLPKNSADGHGLGTRSIAAIVKKYGGACSFEVQNGVFSFKLVI